MIIAIGTANFNNKYGVKSKKIDINEIKAILDFAKKANIKTIDTAAAYGAAEENLGKAGVSDFQVISKIFDLSDSRDPAAELVLMFDRSLDRLNLNRLEGILLHRSSNLHLDGIREVLIDLKKEGKCSKIGISIYDPEELDACKYIQDLDLVQAPMNIFDQRLYKSGWADRLKDLGVEIHARSVFLQGLLLMPSKKRPGYFDRFESDLKAWDKRVQHVGSALQAALQPVVSKSCVAKIVVGVDTTAHLKQLVKIVQDDKVFSKTPPLDVTHRELIDPRCWDSV